MGDGTMKSILQEDKVCFICGNTQVHEHHIYFGANRKASENNGFKVYLCPYHHNMSDEGVHFNKELDIQLKKMCQEKFEEKHTREEFMKIIGKNYL